MATPILTEADKAKILEIVKKQFKTADDFRQPRLKEIRALEDILDYKIAPTLRGKINVPFDSVLANGFVDTLVAQVNQPPRIEFIDPKGGNARGAEKCNAALVKDMRTGRWNQKDRFTKRLCAVANIGIVHFYAESDPAYKSVFKVIDHLDFLCEPMGGGSLEEHDYYGITNNFFREDQIQFGIDSLGYEKGCLSLLKSSQSESDKKVIEDQYQNKINRMAKKGLDIAANNYSGSVLFNLTRWQMTYQGRRVSVLFDMQHHVIVKCGYLSETYESGLWPDVYWQSTEDPFNAWAKGPFDRVAPVFEAIRINLNEILNNIRKRNWDMKIVDGKFFPDLSELDYRPDGVAVANVPVNKNIRDGIYYAETPEVSVAINFTQYLNQLAGINSGVSDQTKGDTSKEVLGLAKIDEMNVSKRVKLIGDSYQDMYEQIGLLWSWGIYEHMSEEMMVKIAGINGSEFAEIQREDLEPDYDVKVISRADELQNGEVEKDRKASALERIAADQALVAVSNPVWRLEQELKLAGWDPDDINRAKDIAGEFSDDQMEEARRGITMILENKQPDLYRKANTSFLNYIDNYMRSKTNLKVDELKKLQKYFDDHVVIVAENEARNMTGTKAPVGSESELNAQNNANTALNTGIVPTKTVAPINPIQ